MARPARLPDTSIVVPIFRGGIAARDPIGQNDALTREIIGKSAGGPFVVVMANSPGGHDLAFDSATEAGGQVTQPFNAKRVAGFFLNTAP